MKFMLKILFFIKVIFLEQIYSPRVRCNAFFLFCKLFMSINLLIHRTPLKMAMINIKISIAGATYKLFLNKFKRKFLVVHVVFEHGYAIIIPISYIFFFFSHNIYVFLHALQVYLRY